MSKSVYKWRPSTPKRRTQWRDFARRKRENFPEYTSWINMKARCSNPSRPDWRHYGGRGITVCRAWKKSFAVFFKDMGRRPAKGYTLSRLDNNGNYEATNCEWQTQSANMRNTRVNVRVKINGVTKCARQWADESGLPWDMVRKRYNSGERGTTLLRPSRQGGNV